MRRQLIVMNSDSVNRKRIKFSIGALEQAAFDNALTGIPALVSHDGLRPIGWNLPYGVYFKPHLTRLIAQYQVAENAADLKVIEKAYLSKVLNRYRKECEPHLDELNVLVGEHKTDSARHAGLGCASIIDKGILNRIYPQLSSKLDKDGLYKIGDLLKQFEYLGQGVFRDRKKNLAIFCHRFFRRSLAYINNFHFEFLDQFMAVHGTPNVTLRIRLDDDAIGLASSFHLREELEYCWGPPYTDDIESIPIGASKYKCDPTQKFFSGVSEMQFWWKNDKDKEGNKEKVLEAEELRDETTNGADSDQYGCRYIHSIHTKDGTFRHFDGAIRSYSTDEMIERVGKEINKAGKHAEYTKLFRIDGKLPIPTWKLLITYYYQGNPLTYEYFGLKQEHEKLLNDFVLSEKNLVERYMPYRIEDDNGLRLFISYHEPTSVNQPFDRIIINPEYSLDLERKEGAIEFYGLEIKKALNRIGEDLTIPEGISFISVKDAFINFPTILHSANDLDKKLCGTINAYLSLLSKLTRRDFTISLTLALPMHDKEVRISVFGKINEISKWLTANQQIPADYPNFRLWVGKQGEWLNANYQPKPDGPDMSDLLSPDGFLFIRRRQVPQDWLQFSEDKRGLHCEIGFPKDATELMNAFERRELRPSLYFVVEEAHCSKTGENYFTSATSKVLDDDVACVVTQGGRPSAFWTAVGNVEQCLKGVNALST